MIMVDQPRDLSEDEEGEQDGPEERASGEAMALAHLMKGVHW